MFSKLLAGMGSYKDSLTGKDFKVYEAHETRIFMSANIDRKDIESCLKIRRMIPSKLISNFQI